MSYGIVYYELKLEVPLRRMRRAPPHARPAGCERAGLALQAHIYVCMCVYVYIYIYICICTHIFYRERESEMYIYIYIYVYGMPYCIILHQARAELQLPGKSRKHMFTYEYAPYYYY